MRKPVILRKRYIPNEIVNISEDELLFRDEELLVTRWKPIKSRKDISHGISFTLLKEGIKISRFFDLNENFSFWYCDIIEVEYNSECDEYTLKDLLIDVKIFPDGSVELLDGDELAEALENNIITQIQVCDALRKMDKLLKMIYNKEFPPKTCRFEEFGA